MEKRIISYKDFSGGLDTSKDATMLEPNKSPNIINFDIDTDALFSRNGFMRWNNTALSSNPVKSLHRFYKENGNKYLLATAGTSLWNVASGEGTSTELKNDLTSNAWVSYNTYIDKAYIMSLSDGLFHWDGTTLTGPVAGAPSAKVITTHSERMWAANTNANKSYIYWSAAFDPTTWVMSDDFIKVSPDDGDEVTGLIPLLDNLVVLKDNSIWMLTGTYDPYNEMQLVKRVTDIGCIAPRTAVTLNNRIYFLSKNDVREFDGVSTRSISKDIESEIKQINQTQRENACAVAYDNKYFLSFTELGDTTNQVVLVYDTVKRSWTKYSGINSNQMITLNGGDDSGELLSASSDSNGLIYQLDTGTSDGWYVSGGVTTPGSAISVVYESPWLDMGIPESKKKLKRAWVYAAAGGNYNLSFNYAFDLMEPGTTINIPLVGSGSAWGALIYDIDLWGGASIVSDRQYVSGKGRYIRFKFTHSGVNEPIRIYGVSLLYKPKRAR